FVLGLGILRRRHHTTADECFDRSCLRLPPPAISAPNINSLTSLPPFNTSYHTNHLGYKSKPSSSFRHQPIFVVTVNAAIVRPNGASGEFPSFLRHHATSVSPTDIVFVEIDDHPKPVPIPPIIFGLLCFLI
ncbi:hypothetical protein V8G54_028365, partial [Vigna mungo]